jgi:plastocyanin
LLVTRLHFAPSCNVTTGGFIALRNGSGRVVLKKAGEVAYYCRFHPNMTANITVAERNPK